MLRQAERFSVGLAPVSIPFPDPLLTAKVFCNEMAVRVTGDAVQIGG